MIGATRARDVARADELAHAHARQFRDNLIDFIRESYTSTAALFAVAAESRRPFLEGTRAGKCPGGSTTSDGADGMIDGRDCFYTDDFMFDVMGIQNLPTCLYQYTSAESLERILASRTLRFSRLDTVNDPEEATAADVPLAASSVFVSCWSAGEAERIPMWAMYGRNFEGVRIKLPTDMFAGREMPMVFEKGGAILTFAGEYTIARAMPAMGTRGCAIIGPNKVWYSDEQGYRNRNLVHREGGTAHFNPYDLGMVKGGHWGYEEEWRFKIAALTFEVQFPDDRYFNEVTLDFARFPVETQALFIPLDPSALDELEVMLGARADATTATQVERILAEHAPRATLTRSRIAIR